MGLFSFLGKNKQETSSGESEFYSRAEEESQAARGGAKRKRSKAAKSEPLDPMLPEKKRARRRLVGAVALVLTVIIGLPMILDSEPKPLPGDIAIQIPSKDKLPPPMAPAIPLAQPEPTRPATAPEAGAAGEMNASALGAKTATPVAGNSATAPDVKTPDSVHKVDTSKTSSSVAEKADAKAADGKHAEVKSAQKSESQSTDKLASEKHATDKHLTDKHDEARAAAILAGKDVDAKPAASGKSGKFVLQVAALASQEKVNELQGKLSDAGFKSYTQKVPTTTGDRIRVRIGPFASKDEANTALAKLGKLGLNAKLVPS